MAKRSNSPRSDAPTYGVFVRFRRQRLTLRRHLPTLEEGLAFAREIRTLRFHNPDRVILVRETDDAIVDEPIAPVSTTRPTEGGAHDVSSASEPLLKEALAALRQPGRTSRPWEDAGLVEEAAAMYARGIAAILREIGPRPYSHVIDMLGALQLSIGETVGVLAYALAHNLLRADLGEPGLLRGMPS
jgi:hypothetical protein